MTSTSSTRILLNNNAINELLKSLQEVADEDRNGRKRIYVHLFMDQLMIIMSCPFISSSKILAHLQWSTSLAAMTSPAIDSASTSLYPVRGTTQVPGRDEAMTFYNNAKYEDFICCPMKPKNDGSLNGLTHFLNRLDMRHQDETWALATFLSHQNKLLDLTKHFMDVPELLIRTHANII